MLQRKNPLALGSLLAGAAIAIVMALSMTANSTVHEIAAVACSGVGDREPPGISDDTKKNFARPVLVNGAVVLVFDPVFDIVIGDSPSAKWPEGHSILNDGLDPADSTHPAFAKCKKLQDLP